jgi:predicted ATPase/DNA-binding winged helix-turn-helix (wHTH) protein
MDRMGGDMTRGPSRHPDGSNPTAGSVVAFPNSVPPTKFELRVCTVDLGRRVVLREGEELPLTEQEVRLLGALAERNGDAVSRLDLYREVWGYRGEPRGRAAAFAVLRLRNKIEVDPSKPDHLITVRGVGYRLQLGDDETRSASQEPDPGMQSALEPPGSSSGGPPATILKLVEGPRRARLPEPVASFVGREAELQRLGGLLEAGCRLVTIAGTGGTGKTRLALRFASRVQEQWAGNVWFLDLSEAHNLDGVLTVAAGALGVDLDPWVPRDAQIRHLAAVLRGRERSLVVIDNCEQLVETLRPMVDALLREAPDLTAILTSRERIHVPGEQLLELHPLPEADAVELLSERTRAVRPGFQVTAHNAADLAAIVRELDGLPLAIELAASRMRLLSVSGLRQRLSRRFELLRLPTTDRTNPRTTTLEGALDWSWDLLEPWEQEALVQCAVFRGGFDLEAADAVLDLSRHVEAPWVLDVVGSLLDKSLLTRDESGGEPRLGMLVSTREYVQSKSAWTDPESSLATSLRERHFTWYSCLGTDEALDELVGPDGTARRVQLASELDNLHAAGRAAAAAEEGVASAGACRAILAVLELQGPWSAGLELVRAVLALESLPPRLRAKLLVNLGRGAVSRPDRAGEAVRQLSEARDIAAEVGDLRTQGRALAGLGGAARAEGRLDDATDLYEQALALHRESNDRVAEGSSLGGMGMAQLEREELAAAESTFDAALRLHQELGNRVAEGNTYGNIAALRNAQNRMDLARESTEAALAIAREVGNRRIEGVLLGNLAIVRTHEGDVEAARALHKAAEALHRETGDANRRGTVLSNLANLHYAEGELEEARECYEEAIRLARLCRNPRAMCISLGNFGEFLMEAGDLDASEASLEEALKLARELGFRTAEGAFGGTRARVLALRGSGDRALVAIEDSIACLSSVGHLDVLARALCERGEIEQLLGSREEARRSLAQAQEHADTLAVGPSQELRLALDRLRARVEDSSDS